jgi:hypothetical protein
MDLLSGYYIKLADILEINNWRNVEIFLSIANGVT